MDEWLWSRFRPTIARFLLFIIWLWDFTVKYFKSFKLHLLKCNVIESIKFVINAICKIMRNLLTWHFVIKILIWSKTNALQLNIFMTLSNSTYLVSLAVAVSITFFLLKMTLGISFVFLQTICQSRCTETTNDYMNRWWVLSNQSDIKQWHKKIY